MIIAIDTDRAILRVTDDAGERQYPLFGPEAFRILSRQWLILGWNLHHSFTFSFMGRQFIQLPEDMLRLGELMWRLRPDVILETGVYEGGSTLFWATLCRMRSHGRVIAIEKDFRPGVREAILEAKRSSKQPAILSHSSRATPRHPRLPIKSAAPSIRGTGFAFISIAIIPRHTLPPSWSFWARWFRPAATWWWPTAICRT
jgi:hypothetical protein